MKQSQSQHDWKQVERQLQKSHEREELRRFAKNDREQIRRKLAMEEDDVGDRKYSGDTDVACLQFILDKESNRSFS